jgi:hypothetical protein
MSAVFMVADNRIGFAPLSTANMRGIGWFRVGRRFAPPVFSLQALSGATACNTGSCDHPDKLLKSRQTI